MAWCRQATSHYQSHCWLSYMSPYGVTRLQWVNTKHQPPSLCIKCHWYIYTSMKAGKKIGHDILTNIFCIDRISYRFWYVKIIFFHSAVRTGSPWTGSTVMHNSIWYQRLARETSVIIGSGTGLSPIRCHIHYLNRWWLTFNWALGDNLIEFWTKNTKISFKQGKSEGFESCDRPIVR